MNSSDAKRALRGGIRETPRVKTPWRKEVNLHGRYLNHR